MDTTTLHITEYRGNQEIDFFDITSFKVQNHGEAVVEINTIPIYPGQTKTIIETDGTRSDFTLQAKFTEEGKIQKFRAIYKQFGNVESNDHLHPVLDYTVTLYNYEQGDIIDFSQNISGHTILTRSFDGGLTFPQENDIDLGFIEANQVVGYNLGGSLETTSIQFRNNDLEADSEIFTIRELPTPFSVAVTFAFQAESVDPQTFTTNKDGEIVLMYLLAGENVWHEYSLGFSTANVEKAIDFPQTLDYRDIFKFRKVETMEVSQEFPIGMFR